MASKKSKKGNRLEVTLRNVTLSFPDLVNPKPYNGKVTYKTDILFSKDDPQLKELKKKVSDFKAGLWGDDKSEWPKQKHPLFKDGDERQDQKEYKGKTYISPSSNAPVEVITPSYEEFDPRKVRGGMKAKKAFLDISSWDNEFGEGVSIYLAGLMIDPDADHKFFGGRTDLKSRAKKDEGEDDEDQDDQDDQDDEDQDDADVQEDSDDDDEEDRPRKSKKKKPFRKSDEDEESEED